MTITVANTANTNSVQYWRFRTNDLAYAMSTKVLTVDSNTTVGNAILQGTLQTNAIYVTNVYGGAIGVPANLTFQTNVSFVGAKTNLGFGSNVSITTGNATHRVLTVNTSDYSILATKIQFSDISDANITAASNGQIMLYITAEGRWKNFNPGSISVGDAATLNGQPNNFYTNSTNQVTGTLPAARLTGAYTGITGVGVLPTLDIGATDTTLSRVSAGDVAVEGNRVYRVGGGDVSVADGGTGASDAATARTNLGLGSMATQVSTSVSISGGSITGITDLAIADGGTGASDVTTARNNLGAAPIVSPNFSGTPTAPSLGRYSQGAQIATVQNVYDTVTNVPYNVQGAGYTLVASDKGKMMVLTGGGAVYIPNGVFQAGDRVDFVQWSGTQNVFTATGGLTLRSSGGKLKTFGPYSGATIWFISSADCVLIGDIAA